ncbi:MAG: hypothetical protein DRP47_06790 [Candidatus Zixiibacteriota bacterium]|nr:MAG: hypothetical protein DRP47_06790 [candidate division Zixibacteria bacterium]
MTLLGLLLSILVSTTTAGSNPKLKLEIELSKEVFLEREPIWLDITLINVSSDTMRAGGLFPPCQSPGPFSVELKDGRGEHMKYTGLLYNMGPAKGPGLLLHPKEQLYGCYDLLELFSTYRSLLRQRFGLLAPGKYSVRGRYGNTFSQEVDFEVVEVTENEMEAYKLLNTAYALWLKDPFDSTNQEFRQIVNQFPNSVYAEKAMREIAPKSELLRQFPNSGYNEQGLRTLTGKLSKGEKTELLQQIISDHPGTRSARFAQQMLKWGE